MSQTPPLSFSELVAGLRFHPVIELPKEYEIFDFTKGYDPKRARAFTYGIGRYNEKRVGMYTTEIFTGGEEPRDIHVGIDIAAPVGTPLHAFYEGRIYAAAVNPAPGDYGGTIITEHVIRASVFWVLWGHLSHASVHSAIERIAPGVRAPLSSSDQVGHFRAGDVIAHVGDQSENGGWNPHVHVQIARTRPEKCDLPGAVRERDLAWALQEFPDPQLILGRLY